MVLLLLLIRWLMLPDSTCGDLHRATSRPSSAQLIPPYVPCFTLSTSHVLINARGEIAFYFASVLITRTGDRVQVNDRDRARVHNRRPGDRDYRRIRVNFVAFTNHDRHAFSVNRLGTIARDKGWKIVTSRMQPRPRKISRESRMDRQRDSLNKTISLARNATCNSSLSQNRVSRLRLGAITLCPNNRWSNPVTGIVPSGILAPAVTSNT